MIAYVIYANVALLCVWPGRPPRLFCNSAARFAIVISLPGAHAPRRSLSRAPEAVREYVDRLRRRLIARNTTSFSLAAPAFDPVTYDF